MDFLDNVPLKINRPINHMPDKQEWMLTIGTRLIIENKPPIRRIYINHIMVSEYKIGDAEAERIAIVHIWLNGIGNQVELAKIWGLHYNTINNYLAAYRNLGIKGLTDLYYQPEARRTKSEDRDNPKPDEVQQLSLFENEKTSIDGQKAESTNEKDDLHTQVSDTDEIEEVIGTQYGGHMVFHPLISEMYENILVKTSDVEQKINGAYSKIFKLRQILLTLLMYVFTGISSPEMGKTICRKEFGVLIGERSSPCCKTLRKGLNMLTVDDFPEYFNRELKRQYVKLKYVELGTLYVDGHFIPYYGKKEVHKGYSTQRRIAMPGHYQNWANDKNGRPIFFYVNNSFVKFADAIRNAVVDTLALMSEAGIDEKLIVVFDRGAYDGKLFKDLDSMGVGFITWQKGGKGCDTSLLDQTLCYTNRKGEEIKYPAHKHIISINNYRSDVEAITVMDETTGKKSTLVNNLEQVGILDRSDSYKIQALDGRWVQENFFKEAKVKEDIDHQMGYQFETDLASGEDLEYDVANPEYVLLKEEIEQLEKKFATSSRNRERILGKFETLKRKTSLEDYLQQKGNKKIIDTCYTLKVQLEEKRDCMGKLQPRIKYSLLHENRKDIFKTVRSCVLLGLRASAYNIRKRFEEMAAECFKDHRELSKFIYTLTSSQATVTITTKCCYVKLRKLETPVYQAAAEKLIQKLNSKNSQMLDGSGRLIIFQF